ncbi:MAG: 2-amino-4-hydroxy-6-hydroxymethyldihydropteridine diphosphokinase [Candidatus Omnitrophota bacterium]|nr:2-amino-4-hydroxy-6-hydroxymethyldihydropteridine diphosphokinase [Candidatus Omnitrophota bacterium]
MAECFIGIGSNLGDREKNIKSAIKLLKKSKIKILKESSLIETKPIGFSKQGKFLNGVLQIETKLEPQKLLQTLKSIEKKLGRIKTFKNGPRTIDLDILTYNDKVIKSRNLTIPHPRIFKRSFVINPLKEISPEIVKLMQIRNR